MSEAEVREEISKIVTGLRGEDPDCEGMIPMVRHIHEEVRRWNLLKRCADGRPIPEASVNGALVAIHLSRLADALSSRYTAMSRSCAEAALLELS